MHEKITAGVAEGLAKLDCLVEAIGWMVVAAMNSNFLEGELYITNEELQKLMVKHGLGQKTWKVLKNLQVRFSEEGVDCKVVEDGNMMGDGDPIGIKFFWPTSLATKPAE